MLRSRKAELLAELEHELAEASSVIVADYRGLTVAQLASVRTDLRPLDASLRVSKNTLARIAAEQTGKAGLSELLAGPTALAFCKGDPAAVAKKLSDVARETRVLALRGGYLEGRVLDGDDVRRLATLPPRDQLVAQLVGTLAAPLTGLATVMSALPRGLVVSLDQIRQQRESATAA